tara:strand:+ start:132 stop:482 length:351 start_codon:yes stop_codon:yes gene_type:complete
MPDRDGYPTDRELEVIQIWDLLPDPKLPQSADSQRRRALIELLDFVRDCWHWPDWGFRTGTRKLYLSTGGWSGNESIITALQGNVLFWSRYWYSHKRGGHYKFELPRAVLTTLQNP